MLNDEQRISPEFWMLYHPQFAMISSDMKNYLFSNIQKFREKLGAEKVDELVGFQINSDLDQVLYNVAAKISVEDIDRTIQFIKQNKLQHSKQLIGLANIVKLFKNKVCSVKAYKKASKDMKPGRNSICGFICQYSRNGTGESGRVEGVGKRDCGFSYRP